MVNKSFNFHAIIAFNMHVWCWVLCVFTVRTANFTLGSVIVTNKQCPFNKDCDYHTVYKKARIKTI